MGPTIVEEARASGGLDASINTGEPTSGFLVLLQLRLRLPVQVHQQQVHA
jgi:hypothetical protein